MGLLYQPLTTHKYGARENQGAWRNLAPSASLSISEIVSQCVLSRRVSNRPVTSDNFLSVNTDGVVVVAVYGYIMNRIICICICIF
jgi:hypothetical protein